jgi:hypothetical protein
VVSSQTIPGEATIPVRNTQAEAMSSPMPLQDRTDISQQAATTSWPPLKDATVNALKYLRPKAMKEQYITAKDRANLKITCGQLDFGSAKSRFGKQNIQFLELMSVEDMKKLANEHNLQQADQLDPIWLPPRFDTACDVFDIFNGHLDCFYNGANLVHRSLWECRE